MELEISPEQIASAQELADATGEPVEHAVDWLLGRASPPVAIRQAMRTLELYSLLPQSIDEVGSEAETHQPSAAEVHCPTVPTGAAGTGTCEVEPLSGDPEADFAARRDRSTRKRLGQFFTPRPLADLMTSWLEECSPKTILDPAVGPGMLLHACASRGVGQRLVGVDVDELALAFARRRLSADAALIEGDFLQLNFDEKFDAVISNPPYVRHHSFDIAQDVANRIVLASGQRFGKLTNLYVYFILRSIEALRTSGRASFLIPAEWANANYGQGLKNYFRETGFLKRVIYFSHEGLPFTDNLSTACILCVKKTGGDGSVTTHYVSGDADLSSLNGLETSKNVFSQRLQMKALSQTKKWDALLASADHDHRAGSVPLGQLGRTRRGIATGDNSYFMLDAEMIRERRIPMSAVQRCIAKATNAAGFVFSEEDFDRLVAKGSKTFLFNPADASDPSVASYLQEGIERGVTERYLTRTKPKWYRAEDRPPAPILVTVFGRGRLKFVRNKTNCRNLTAFHCLYTSVDDPVFHDALVACLNSGVIAGAVAKHQRVYGGGLLKMEPKDILEIDVPDLRKIEATHLRALADELPLLDRDGQPSERLNSLVDEAFEAASRAPDRLL